MFSCKVDFGHIRWTGPASKNPTAILSEDKKLLLQVFEEKEVRVIFQLISSALLTVRPPYNKAHDVFKDVLNITTFNTFFMALTIFIAG